MNLDQAFAELGVKVNMTVVILTAALLMSRILPVLILSPIFGGETTPPDVKIGLGVMFTIVLFPAVSSRVSFVPTAALPFIALLFKEIFIGLSLAFIVEMVFEAARIAGSIVDAMGGYTMAQMMVPQIATQVTLFSTLKMMLAITLFLTLNGHHLVLTSLADSLAVVPLDQFPHFRAGLWPFFQQLLEVFAELFRIGMSLAAPAMLATFASDLALGMINRVAPQIQVFFISMSIKPLAAVAVMFVAIHLIVDRLQNEYAHMLRLFSEAITRLG